jgi:hypothetical protein
MGSTSGSEVTESAVIARLERLETESELTRLVYNYCHGLDRHDRDLYMGIWHDDAVFNTNSPMGNFVGKEDIERGLVEVFWRAIPVTHHWTVNFVTQIDGDRATGLSNLTHQGVDANGTAIIVAATYHDEFERRDGPWLIARRDIELHHFAPLPNVDWRASAV